MPFSPPPPIARILYVYVPFGIPLNVRERIDLNALPSQYLYVQSPVRAFDLFFSTKHAFDDPLSFHSPRAPLSKEGSLQILRWLLRNTSAVTGNASLPAFPPSVTVVSGFSFFHACASHVTLSARAASFV